jgi:hypothetical protein
MIARPKLSLERFPVDVFQKSGPPLEAFLC